MLESLWFAVKILFVIFLGAMIVNLIVEIFILEPIRKHKKNKLLKKMCDDLLKDLDKAIKKTTKKKEE